jgi:hypothetical protein
VQQNTQCKWLSITNGDNIYGSDVFKHVLEVGVLKDNGKSPDVMLSPLDSRNYADQGMLCTVVSSGNCHNYSTLDTIASHIPLWLPHSRTK